jgi:hypothetical protein
MFDPVRGRWSGLDFSVGSGEPTAIRVEPCGFYAGCQEIIDWTVIGLVPLAIATYSRIPDFHGKNHQSGPG